MCGTRLAFGSRSLACADLSERWSFHVLPAIARVPGTARIMLAVVTDAGGVVEILIDKLRRWRNFANGKRFFAKAVQRERERFHVRNLARHQELKSVLRSRIVAKIDEPLVDYFRARFRRDIAAQIHI